MTYKNVDNYKTDLRGVAKTLEFWAADRAYDAATEEGKSWGATSRKWVDVSEEVAGTIRALCDYNDVYGMFHHAVGELAYDKSQYYAADAIRDEVNAHAAMLLDLLHEAYSRPDDAITRLAAEGVELAYMGPSPLFS